MTQTGAAYVFLDEGGNFDFSPNGTKFFTLSGITTFRPFNFDPDLSDLKHDLIESGIDLDYFHASEDRQEIRNQVFDIIEAHRNDIRIDSIVVEKSKTASHLREIERFYPKMLGYLLRYIFRMTSLKSAEQVIVMTDTLPNASKRKAVEKAIRQTMPLVLDSHTPYRLLHRQSCSSFGLQVADYCNWAIYRKWTMADERSYARIKNSVRSEFDIFRYGLYHWY